MHLYSILRGRKHLIDRHKQDWEDVFLPVKDKDGNLFWSQVIPRKVELVEYVFPKEHLAQMVRTLTGRKDVYNQSAAYMGVGLQTAALRKILGAKKIPTLDLKDVEPLTCRGGQKISDEWVSNLIIGIKEDKVKDNGLEDL